MPSPKVPRLNGVKPPWELSHNLWVKCLETILLLTIMRVVVQIRASYGVPKVWAHVLRVDLYRVPQKRL